MEWKNNHPSSYTDTIAFTSTFPTTERLSYLLVSKVGLPQQKSSVLSHLKLSPIDMFPLFHKMEKKNYAQTQP